MTPQENKTIVQRYLETAWNKKDPTIDRQVIETYRYGAACTA